MVRDGPAVQDGVYADPCGDKGVHHCLHSDNSGCGEILLYHCCTTYFNIDCVTFFPPATEHCISTTTALPSSADHAGRGKPLIC